jgi:hypothetical protein
MTAIILLLVGVIVTWLSAASLWRAVRLQFVGQRVSGVLVNWRHTYRHRWLGNGLFMELRHFHPIVRFEVPGGSHHEVVSDLAYDAVPDWPVGRPFPVRYDPANPKDATIDPLPPTWIFLAVFLVAGLIVLYAALRLCFS